MNNNTNKLIPDLRFPEFANEGEWEEKKLGDMTIKVGSGVTPLGGESNYRKTGHPFVRSQNVGWGVFLLNNIAFIDEVTHQNSINTEIELEDVLLNITGASIGRSAVANQIVAGGNVNQHVCIIRTKKDIANPFFVNQFLISDLGQKQIDSFQAGGNRQGLNFEQIRSFIIPTPKKIREQQKIASCLSSLNEVIAAHTQKLEALKEHKKGLMQNLFPQEGETVPKFRFPEFEKDGEWAEKTLEEVCEMQAGKFASASEIKAKPSDGLFPCYGGNGLRGYTKSFTHTGKFSLIGRQGALCGNVTLVDGTFHATEHAVVVTPKKKTDTVWLFYELELLNLNQYATGQAQPGLSVNNLERLKLDIPIHPTEQQKIADCLLSLDDLITVQAEKIEQLKLHKKGLMQGLFPKIND